MGEYLRSTRKCSFDDFKPEIREKMMHQVESYDLGDIVSEALICCETLSERKKKSLFGKDRGLTGEKQYTDIMVTPRFLIWGIADIRSTFSIWARLSSLDEVKDYRDTFFSDKVDDTGMSIHGFLADAPERDYSFIGLGEGDAASEEFKEVLLDAWTNARRSSDRNL